jgi:hypothetical protein
MVPDVLDVPTNAKPEGFIAIDPDGRLMTVNSKASISARFCRITSSGDLTAPPIGGHQRAVDYSTLRANLISPLEGDVFAWVVKVDLVHMKAQIFDVAEDGRLTRVGPPCDVGADVVAVLGQFPDGASRRRRSTT